MTDLGQEPEHCRVTVNVMAGYTMNPAETTLTQFRDEPFVQLAKKAGGATWESVRLEVDALRLRVRVDRDRDEGDDRITIEYGQDPSDPVEVGRSLAAVQRQFMPFGRVQAMKQALGPELATFYLQREEGLTRLEGLARNIVEETHNYRLQLDGAKAEDKAALTASFDEKHLELEGKYQEQASELKAREGRLEQRRRDLDDRSARHARREQGKALQDKISKSSSSFTLTPDTQRKRWPIHMLFVSLLIVSGYLIVQSLRYGYDFTSTVDDGGASVWPSLIWLLAAARLTLSVLGFGFTAVFYIRWNDLWFRQHADQEFKLKQLALDVDRAGYVTEMLLEWQDKKVGEMPTLLLDRLTAGLFADPTTGARALHPAEDVTSVLLKASSGVRVDVPGIGEVNYTGRQIRKLDRELAKARDE